MKMTLEQAPKEKTRAEWAESTIEERMSIAAIASRIVSAELGKRPMPIERTTEEVKATIIAHAIQMAFAIARGVALEDIRRHGDRIDQV